MSQNDQSYFLGQGVLSLQRRALNGAAIGGFRQVGDADKFEISTSQSFDDIQESQTGLRLTAAHIPTGTKISYKANLKILSKKNFAAAIWGSDMGTVAGGTVSAEVAYAWNNGVDALSVPLANPGVSAETITLLGYGGVTTAGALANIAVTAGGSGYTAKSKLALTLAGSPGTGAVGYAVTDDLGVVVGAYLTAGGSGYVAPTATITTPGGGSGCTLVVNLKGAAVVASTDYTLDAVYGGLNVVVGSTIIPSFVDRFGVSPDGSGQTWLNCAYTYAGYQGKVEAFTKGISYFTARLNGVNVNNSQPVIVNTYQIALDMAKLLSFIDSKSMNLELDGMLLQDTVRALPTPTLPYSQFFNIVKV